MINHNKKEIYLEKEVYLGLLASKKWELTHITNKQLKILANIAAIRLFLFMKLFLWIDWSHLINLFSIWNELINLFILVRLIILGYSRILCRPCYIFTKIFLYKIIYNLLSYFISICSAHI